MKPVKPDVNFPALEEEILDFWQQNQIVEKGLNANAGAKPFVFYDGPPFATGTPHYGHIIPGTLKDIVPRYWVMKGRYVERRWGWDCHGLPVEYEMEKELGLKGLADIQKMGIAKFNEACRSIVLRYTKEWEKIITRTGRWADFKNGYRTMDPHFMETVWWAVKELWKKNLVFEGHRVMPYSWRVSTPLSNFEAALNYKEVQDPAITVKLKNSKENYYFLVWTTTPWTLPSNLAIAVHPEIEYVKLQENESKEIYVLGESRVSEYFKDESAYTLLERFPGRLLEGKSYEPLFSYFADKEKEGAFKVLLADYVTVSDGTGLVHQAPAFGEEDMATCKKYGIELVDPIDEEGKFNSLVPEYTGQFVKDADKEIIKDLKQRKAILRHDTIVHNYPYCWRTDTPLIYKAISTWFVRLDPIKQDILDGNSKTHWVPEHIRDGRFGNWLENARDWNISRNRFWGTPIPIWKCTSECDERICIGSREELFKLSGKKPDDLHKHFVDEITFPCPKCGGRMKRIPEVLDCWFESGSMPYAQAHYPFENKESFEKTFPADFIAEGLDQTRGWFYTLTVLGNALFKKSPFKNVIVNGLLLAEDGKKMSKSLKNYPPITKVLDEVGADALRAYLMASPVSHAEEARFSEKGVKEVIRSVSLPYWNAYSFFVTYGLADGWQVDKFDIKTLKNLENDTDRWILSRLQNLIQQYEKKMEEYHLYEVIPLVLGFIDDLTNWYIRINRRRYWKEGLGDDKEAAYQVLYFVLTEFTKLLAPIMPFLSESVFQNLRNSNEKADSVHLSAFPTFRKELLDPKLEEQVELIRKTVSMGRNCRNIEKIKTRQPLRKMLVITKNPRDNEAIQKYQDLLASELNVKEVGFSTEESKWVSYTAKPNAKVLGPKLGPKMKEISNAIRQLSPEKISELDQKGTLEILGEKILSADVVIERTPLVEGAIQTEQGVTLWLDTKLSEDLILEGQAREIVSRIQKLRKDQGFEVSDRITILYHCESKLEKAILTHRNYIQTETLATELKRGNSNQNWNEAIDLEGHVLKLALTKNIA